MKLIDLSQPIFHQCPRPPSDPPVQSAPVSALSKEGWLVEQLTLSSHTGSHVEVPRHIYAGAPTIDEFPLEQFVGQAYILDWRQNRPRQPFTSSMLNRTLRQRPELKGKIILLATGWGEKRAQSKEWETEAPFLSPDGAEWLVDQEVRGVGIDHHSIGGSIEPSNSLAHKSLLGANVWILEDLRFPPEVFSLPQPVQFWALPIHLKGHGAAFCRPVLVV